MFGLKRIVGLLESVERKLDELLLDNGQVGRLEEQNNKLFDRLMAVDWEKFAYLREEKDTGSSNSLRYIIPPTSDESNIGEVLTDEDIG